MVSYKGRTRVRTSSVSKVSSVPVDHKRSLVAKKGVATRKANVLAAANRRSLRLHHKILAGGLIAAVLVLTFVGIRSQLNTYAATTTTGTTFVGLGNKCLDDKFSQVENRNWIWLYQCNSTGAQKWILNGSAIKTSLNDQNYCIDDPGSSKQDGIAVWLYQCNGSKAQQWTFSGGHLINAVQNDCLTVKNGSTSNGTRLVLKRCDGSSSQNWTAKSSGIANGQPIPTIPASGNSTGGSGGGSTSGTGSSAVAPVSGHWTTKFASTNVTGSSINCNGQSNIMISGHTFSNIGNDRPAITINGCNNVTITDNDFINDCEPIYVYNSHNVTIAWNRYENITGPHTRNGSNRGNFTQWNQSFGGSISNNKGIGGDTEDIVSIYQSGGNSAGDPLVIQNNAFEGTNWSSQSGSGMMLGDGGGSHIVARNNTLVNPGQVGIGISGGTDIHVTGNTIYGEQRANSNIGIYVANYGGGPMSGEEVSNNQVDWKNASGTNNPAWNSGDAGTVVGWSTNNFNANLNPNTLAVML